MTKFTDINWDNYKPLNHKGEEYNPITELYMPNKWGTYERFTDTDGKQEYKDRIVVDHTTGGKYIIGKIKQYIIDNY